METFSVSFITRFIVDDCVCRLSNSYLSIQDNHSFWWNDWIYSRLPNILERYTICIRYLHNKVEVMK